MKNIIIFGKLNRLFVIIWNAMYKSENEIHEPTTPMNPTEWVCLN